ncbi:hypothetical protein [Haloferula sp.]|uniref:hypothetical protein n=1 Tax=Haloferula sp. TaxID=2497595 RepID=UPI003C78E6BD
MKTHCVPRHRLFWAAAIVYLFNFLPSSVSADPLDEWSWRSPIPTSHGVRSIAKGNGLLVAVADGPTFLRSSDDGVKWEVSIEGTPSLTRQLLDIAFGNGIFVAAGNAGQVFSSSDGQNWAPHSVGTGSHEFRSVAFGAGKFVIAGVDATGMGAALYSSPDGSNWTSRDGGISGQYHELVFENNEFIACGGNTGNAGFVTTSSNGTIWTPLVEDLATPPYSVTHGLGKYFTMTPSVSSIVYQSSDGTTWTGGPVDFLSYHQQIRVFDGKLVSFDIQGFIPDSNVRTSIDGTTWTPVGSVPKIHQLKIADGLLYALSGPENFNRAAEAGIFRSSDASEWEALHQGPYGATPLKAVAASATGFRVAGPGQAAELDGPLPANLSLFDFEPLALFDSGDMTLAAGMTGIHSSSDGTNYSQLGYTPMNDLTGNGSIHVAVGNDGLFSYSEDGSFWNDVFTGLGGDFRAVAFGGGIFVAVGDSGAVATSTDGMNWSGSVSGELDHFSGIAYGAGVFVAVGNGGAIMTSPDGATWETRSGGTIHSLNRVHFLDGKFRAVGKGGTLVESVDGIAWASVPLPVCLELFDIAGSDDGFRIVGQGSLILESADGLSWSARQLQPSGSSSENESILCAGGGFYVSGDSGGLLRSAEGKSWFPGGDWMFPRVYDFVSHEGTIVAVGELNGGDSVIATSTDNGVSWSQRDLGSLGSFEGAAYGNGVFVAVGERSFSTPNSVIASSPDGLDWTVRDSGTNRNFLDVTFGNGLFVAVNGSQDVVTSPDGITWTVRSDAASGNMNAVLFANDMFVGGSSDMFTSPDGIAWTKTDTVVGGVNGIAYGAGTYLAVCNSGYIHSSSDGMSWTQRESPTFQKLWDVAFGSDTFVIVGFNGTILQSGHLGSSSPVIDWLSPAASISTENINGIPTSFYALSVTAKGRGPFAYQWFRDDLPLAEGDDYLLRLPIDGENAGSYHVVVTNEFGEATSDPIQFVVVEPEFRMEIRYDNTEPTNRFVELMISAPPDQTYDLYVIPIPGPVEWQYLDSIYVSGDHQTYLDYLDFPIPTEDTGRLYQLRGP